MMHLETVNLNVPYAVFLIWLKIQSFSFVDIKAAKAILKKEFQQPIRTLFLAILITAHTF